MTKHKESDEQIDMPNLKSDESPAEQRRNQEGKDQKN